MPITRNLTIIAQDPSVQDPDGRIVTASVALPFERLDPGPRGYRVHVVDYDSVNRVLYRPFDPGGDGDPFKSASDKTLCSDPGFHAQNVYAIVMRLLAQFEKALGRRVSWGFGGHLLHVAPHAFAEANAYYSDDSRGLYFGCFPGSGGQTIFTCLSHDIVAHETTHALLDGLRESYTLPSHPDQAGFHEGFADIVALLSVFGLRDVVRQLVPGLKNGRVNKSKLDAATLRRCVLLGLAEQFGQEASRHSSDCLRRSVTAPPDENAYYKDVGFNECHLRGEILAAAVLNSFIEVWVKRLGGWLPKQDKTVPVDRVAEDGADAAEHLLTMCVRALDYCPTVDLTFPDFLSALLTADYEFLPHDGRYGYREILKKQFAQWGIKPASGMNEDAAACLTPEAGAWEKPDCAALDHECVHREPLEQNGEEVFRFLWENRVALGVYPEAYTRVISVRPCIRVGLDGFVLRETVSEYRQVLDLEAGQLAQVCKGMKKPDSMPRNTLVRLNGGGVLVFNEFGLLKYHIRSRIDNPARQNSRLQYLWENNIRDSDGKYGFTDGAPRGQRFALMHVRRDNAARKEDWDE